MDESRRMCMKLYAQLRRYADRNDDSLCCRSAQAAIGKFCDEAEAFRAQMEAEMNRESGDDYQDYKNIEINILKNK